MLNFGIFCIKVIANIWVVLQLKFFFKFPVILGNEVLLNAVQLFYFELSY